MKNIKWEAVYVAHIIASGISAFTLLISLQVFFVAFFLANVLVGVLLAAIAYLADKYDGKL